MPDAGAVAYENGVARVVIDLRCYRLSAIKKSGYRFASQCTLTLGEIEGNLVAIAFTFPERTPEARARELVRLFFEDLLDQELREQIGEETKAVRALILAQAFSRTDLLRRD